MNYCGKCGDPVEPNERFCNKCGAPLLINQNLNEFNSENNLNDFQNKKINNQLILKNIGIIGGIIILIFISMLFYSSTKPNYYFEISAQKQDNIIKTEGTSSTNRKNSTVIIYDNTYSGVSIKKKEDAYNLIEKDSVSQKDKCPANIKTVENQIINKYGIIAVNLCELDVNFAKEISNVIKMIYDEYPSSRGYITNLSLANASLSDGYIAAFMPVFNFATSNTSSTYPWIIKTQILLNTSYFLNLEKLQSSVTSGSSVGHFPPNATIYSPVAHEFGHYLSFLSVMKNYNTNSILLVNDKNNDDFYKVYSDYAKGDFSLKMIKEAYENYKRDTNTTIGLDAWRETISKYALAKDNNGNYIWDETIAEAFHDVYLNGNNAKDASKYIIKVLKSKLEG